MQRDTASDLVAFAAVARAGSFTRAAVALGLSQSALSHAIRAFEDRLGLRLLARTTRSVAPTEAGQRLLAVLQPRLDEIDAELAALTRLRDTPSGTIRLTCGDHAADTVVFPRLAGFLETYPEVKVEVGIDYGLTDIVAQRFDAGIRMGEQVERDMVAVKVGPDLRMACFGAPSYLAQHPAPKVPQDLTAHTCINLRLTTQGGIYAWEFAQGGQALRVRVEGRLIFNSVPQIVKAARMGLGLAFLPEDRVTDDVASGRLVRMLDDWCPYFPGYFLYYPSRRQPSAAFARLVETLRWRPPGEAPTA